MLSAPVPSRPDVVFGHFRFIPHRRLLLRGAERIRLGSRAREILHTLVGRAGEIVSKAELMQQVWPHAVVEEGALRVHIASLRRALGENGKESQYIETVNGRGYRFVPCDADTHRTARSPLAIAHVAA
jgi:DNA-binding winged helix-turn-helix (wHTH) protein